VTRLERYAALWVGTILLSKGQVLTSTCCHFRGSEHRRLKEVRAEGSADGCAAGPPWSAGVFLNHGSPCQTRPTGLAATRKRLGEQIGETLHWPCRPGMEGRTPETETSLLAFGVQPLQQFSPGLVPARRGQPAPGCPPSMPASAGRAGSRGAPTTLLGRMAVTPLGHPPPRPAACLPPHNYAATGGNHQKFLF